jgi:hypothetical protein
MRIGAKRVPPGLGVRHSAELVIAVLMLPPALELLSARRVLRAVDALPSRRGEPAQAKVLARAVDALQRRLPGVWHHSCLRRAVVLAAMLRRDGRRPEVRLGVRRTPSGTLEAHAWLRCDGEEPFLEDAATKDFTPLERSAT